MTPQDHHKVWELAAYLESMPPEDRLLFVQTLKQVTDFCWACGCDEPSNGYCQCENDE